MKLLWSSRSPFVRKVVVVAHELADRLHREPPVPTPAVVGGGEFIPIGALDAVLELHRNDLATVLDGPGIGKPPHDALVANRFQIDLVDVYWLFFTTL